VSRRSQVIDRPGLFACGLVPALLTLLIRAWVPESPRWLVAAGALQVSPASLPLPKLDEAATRQTAGSDLFRYPRSLLVSWLSNLGMQTTGYILWAPTLFVMLLGVSPAQASYLFIFVSLAGFVGRFVFSGLSELIGCGSRRARQAGPRVRIRLPPAASLLRT
jgi:putative MFS transporter